MQTDIRSITYIKRSIFSNFLHKMTSIIFIYALEIGTMVDILNWTNALNSQNKLKFVKIYR